MTNTSVNPARSTGVALFAGVELVGQLWLFWLAPIVGALLAGWLYNSIFAEDRAEQALADALTSDKFQEQETKV